MDAQAAIVPHCPRPEISRDAQKLVHAGRIFSLLPEECVGRVPVDDGCGPVLLEAGGISIILSGVRPVPPLTLCAPPCALPCSASLSSLLPLRRTAAEHGPLGLSYLPCVQ